MTKKYYWGVCGLILCFFIANHTVQAQTQQLKQIKSEEILAALRLDKPVNLFNVEVVDALDFKMLGNADELHVSVPLEILNSQFDMPIRGSGIYFDAELTL